MIDLLEARELQKEVEEKYGIHVHIHDQCGHGLWLGLDQENDTVKEYLVSRLEDKGCTAEVSESGLVIGVR